MSPIPDSGRATRARFRPDINEYIADWFLTPAARSDVVDIVLEPPCVCGNCLGKIFRTTRYHNVYGPVHWGGITLASYEGWPRLVTTDRATEEEHAILVAMSENEGKMDAVQSYDSEILTAGAMQKTINPEGAGEFPKQVLEFKNEHPKLYDAHFLKCGWEVNADKEPVMSYKGQTGAVLKKLIRNGFDENGFQAKIRKQSKPLAAIVHAISTEEFQDKQVEDFIHRLRGVMALKPQGSTDHTIGDYTKSRFGKAVLLDQHVNRPAYVSRDFAKALTKFHIEISDAPKDPRQWGSQHPAYELKLLDIYGELRRMTDSEKRFNALRKKL